MMLSDATRDRILAHGLGIASRAGWHALSFGDLARDLDLPKSGLARHFATKDELQLAVLDQAAQLFIRDVNDVAAGESQGATRLRTLFWRWLNWSRAPRLKGGCPFVHASAESEALPPAVRARLKEVLDAWSAVLREAIDAARGQTIATDTDADQLIFELHGLYLSHHFWHWSMRDPTAEARTMRAFDRIVSSPSRTGR
ncbi:MAG TPA: TetR/AcrR family transcriptional regulator [Hyphomicrobiaceae bacterium]|nr:TetR/AcrR family transcriptional regulator [Hyphomicrobiaceae bacterium]